MSRFPLALGLLALVACGGNSDVEDPDRVPVGNEPTPDPIAPTADPAPAMRISGAVTDANGNQNARLAGPGTLAATAGVQVVTLDGTVLGSASLDAGAYTVGLAELPTDLLLIVEALDVSGAVLGSVVVETTGATELAASPLDVESSVEAAVFANLLADGAAEGIWAEVRNRVDVPVALAVHGESDVDLALDNLAVAVDASWQAHVDAWTEAGVSVDAMSDAWFAASTALSTGLAAGESDAYDAFEAALVAAAEAEGLTADAIEETESVAHASVRAALQATAASEAVTLEAFRATALAESLTLKSTVNAEVLAMQANGSTTVSVIETAFEDLEAAIDAATTPEEIEAAVDAWRDTVLTAIEDEITSQLDLIDQLIATITAALQDIEVALGELETAIQGVVDAAVGVIDAADIADEIGTAFENLQTSVEEEFADLDAEDADAMTTVSLAFAGL